MSISYRCYLLSGNLFWIKIKCPHLFLLRYSTWQPLHGYVIQESWTMMSQDRIVFVLMALERRRPMTTTSDIVLDNDVEGRQFWRTLRSSRTLREHHQFCEKSFTGKALNLATIHHRLRQSLCKFFLTEEYNFFHVMNEENVLQISSAMYFKLYYF